MHFKAYMVSDMNLSEILSPMSLSIWKRCNEG